MVQQSLLLLLKEMESFSNRVGRGSKFLVPRQMLGVVFLASDKKSIIVIYSEMRSVLNLEIQSAGYFLQLYRGKVSLGEWLELVG